VSTEPRSAPPTLDPITLEVLWSRLIAAVEEQARTLMRTAMSGILSDAGDLSAGVFDLGANMVAQAVTGTPGHINTMARGARRFVAEYPLDTLAPGDVLIGNHPYEISGHLNDITTVTPVFNGGRVVGFLANCCHVADIGGRGLGVEAHDVYEEGLHIPYTKLYDRGKPNDELIRLIRANVRTPEFFFGDLHAMVVANDTGVRRLGDLLREFDLPDIEEVSRAILDRTEAAMRQAIRAVPGGVYRHTMTVDGYDEPLTIACQVTVQGDALAVDFSGTSPQVRWGINVPLGYITAYTTYALKTVIAPDIPNNEGSFRPVRVTAPEGSLLNPRYPAPVASRAMNGHLAAMCVISALAEPLPGRVLAEGAIALFNLVFRGETRTGGLFNVNFMNAGGMGARPERDGLSATAFPSGIRGTPVEVIETTSPLFVRQKDLRTDSAGAGRARGGLGQVLHIAVDTDTAYHFPGRFSRAHYPPLGALGGQPALPLRIRTTSGRDLHPMAHHLLPAGEEVILELPGGGGYGDPFQRDASLVLRDVLGGYVSAERARNDYGVVVDVERRAIDEDATRQLRTGRAEAAAAGARTDTGDRP
jgi:N-methylhydantoinase B